MSNKIEQIEVKGGKVYDLTDKQAHIEINELKETKQDKLTQAQLDAVNSGITETILNTIQTDIIELDNNKVETETFTTAITNLTESINNLDELKADKSELLSTKTELQASIDQEKLDRASGDTATLSSANAYTDSKAIELQTEIDKKTDITVTQALDSRVITNTSDIATLKSQIVQKADKSDLENISVRLGKAEIQAFERLPQDIVNLDARLDNYYTKPIISSEITFTEDYTVQNYIDEKVATGIVFQGSVQNGTELLTKPKVQGHVWYIEEDDGTEYKAGCSYIYEESKYAWVLFSKAPKIDLTNYAKKTELQAEATTRENADLTLQNNIDITNSNLNTLATKVNNNTTRIEGLETNVESLTTRVETAESNITTINTTLSTKADKVELTNYYKKTETYNQTEIDNKLLLKQDELSSINAGDNITINKIGGVVKITAATTTSLDWEYITNKPNTISGYGIIDAYTKTETDTLLNKKENNLTFVSGTGINVNRENDTITISNTQTSAVWGNIQGTLSNQTDLQDALDSKANKASTLAGYGILDAYTKTETDTLIANEKEARELEDNEINNKIGTGFDSTNTVRKAIDTNTNAIATEKNRAETIESGLDTRITSIESKIPTDASESNKLTDKNYVDTELAKKQNNLTAGQSIDITGTVISVIKANETDFGVAKLYSTTGNNTDGSITQSGITTELNKKQDVLTFDNTPTKDSSNPVTSTGIKTYVDNKISGTFRYKGSVDNYSDLPTSGNEVGDVWNIKNADPEHQIKAGDNVAWTGTEWDVLSGIVDLSNYYNKQEIGGSYTSSSSLTSYINTELAKKQDELTSANAGENITITKVGDVVKITAATTTSLDWSAITNKPTTISGYGITDAYTKNEIGGSFSESNTLKDYIDTELSKKETLDEYTVRYKLFDTNRKTIQLDNNNTISGLDTTGTGHNLIRLSNYDIADVGDSEVHLNLNTKDNVTVNDSDLVITDKLLDTVIKSTSGAIQVETKTQSISGLTVKTLEISAKTCKHEQVTASSEWVINHNLGKVPSYYVIRDNGNRLICNMEIVDMNNVKLLMDRDYAGIAYLS